MSSKHEIRLVGNGGQGLILASVILAEAAVLSGKHTAQSQSYGPEARGGSCKAETIISDEAIGFTKVQKPSFILSLTQSSMDEHGAEISPDGILLTDSTITVPQGMTAARIISLPILKTAGEAVGRIQTANIVAIGCINEILKIARLDVMKRSVLSHVPSGTEAMNMKALEEGIKLAKGLRQK